jgi:hypothetical protein
MTASGVHTPIVVDNKEGQTLCSAPAFINRDPGIGLISLIKLVQNKRLIVGFGLMVIKVLQRRTKRSNPSLIPPLVRGETQGGLERLFERIGSGQRLHSKHKRREPDLKICFYLSKNLVLRV